LGRRDKYAEIPATMKKMVYLNGNFMEAGHAFISHEDRGFNFADGVYEVVKYYQGSAFRMQDHLDRLAASLTGIQIPYTEISLLEGVFVELLVRNGLSECDAGIYLQITRGAHPRVHHFPDSVEPTVYAMAFPFPSNSEALEKGIRAITAADIRWLRCDIKSVSLLPNTLLFNEAVVKGAGESVLIRDGKITEATHSSVFGVKNGVVRTHPLSNLILPGITRKVILEICSAEGIPFLEEAIPEEDICTLEELFIAGTGSEITPVISIDSVPVADGNPGKLTRRLQHLFFKALPANHPNSF
jgi:D-alanine transaminase